MARPDDRARLRHMLASAREAVALVVGRSRDSLRRERVLVLALTRLIEVVGEAAARVTAEGQAWWPQIPWRLIVAMRNRLIHGYDSIDLDVLWDTIEQDLPPLIAALELILGPDAHT